MRILDFINNYIENHHIKWIYEFGSDGYTFPWTTLATIVLFIILLYFLTKNETKDDEYLINGTTTTGGTIATIILTIGIVYGCNTYILTPLKTKMNTSFKRALNTELYTLQNSEDINDNLEFIKGVKYLQDVEKGPLYKVIPQKYLTEDLEIYIKKRYLKTMDDKLIFEGLKSLNHISKKTNILFQKILIKKMCKTTDYKNMALWKGFPKTHNFCNSDEFLLVDKCNVEYLLKYYKEDIGLLKYNYKISKQIAKKLNGCKGVKFLKNELDLDNLLYQPLFAKENTLRNIYKDYKRIKQLYNNLNKKYKCEKEEQAEKVKYKEEDIDQIIEQTLHKN